MDLDDIVIDRGFSEWERLLNGGCKFPPAANEQESQVCERVEDSILIKGTLENHYYSMITPKLRPKESSLKTKNHYLPLSGLKYVLSHKNLEEMRKCWFPGEDRLLWYNQIWGSGFQTSRARIFVLLLRLEKPQHITLFRSHELFDSSLPLLRTHAVFQAEGFTDRDADLFVEKQDMVLAPFFHFNSQKIKHYKLNNETPIPLLSKEQVEGGSGTHGRVWKVLFHHDHYYCEEHENWGIPGPYYALKKFHRDRQSKKDDFYNERAALERFSGSQSGHIHLIPLLMSYETETTYYMVFPWARHNLEQFWEKVPNRPDSSKSLNWMIKQCHGLAKALQKVHTHESWNGLQNRGRHGDIKPLNILCFSSQSQEGDDDAADPTKYRLVIADFTLMRFHSPHSVDQGTASKVGYSRTYQPPETRMGGEEPVNQMYDVWTLGCVYLELITWHLLGSQAIYEKFNSANGPQTQVLQGFQTLRRLEDNKQYVYVEDKFFNIDGVGGPSVKPSVQRWFKFLRQQRHCSKQLGLFLDLIKNHMLRAKPGQRYKIDRICSEMNYILANPADGNECRLDPPLGEIDTCIPLFTSDTEKYLDSFCKVPLETRSQTRPNEASINDLDERIFSQKLLEPPGISSERTSMETTTISRAPSTIRRGSISQPTQRQSRPFLSPSDAISNAETRLGSAHSNESDEFKRSIDFMEKNPSEFLNTTNAESCSMKKTNTHNGQVSMRNRVIHKLERLKSRLRNLVERMMRH
ncbi:unnamed protein product [Clonostachys byssicola]|uniref:Protein kinase domain-containing protein n=1 Tax=Clonostachys byssicola TaxID=160290 RepID=A0A9N9UKF8_9HYPO|nr:unnamed protein product [Clonostachys byssicola]